MSMSVWIRRYGRTVTGVMCVMLVSYSAYWGIDQVFRLQTLVVVGNNFQVAIDEKRLAKNVLFFPSERLRQELLNDYPILEDVIFRKQLPHAIEMSVLVREPVLEIQTPKQVVFVAHGGVTTAPPLINNRILPILHIDLPPVSVGKLITHPLVQVAVRFIEEKPSELQVSRMQAMDFGSLSVFTDMTEVVLTSGGDMKEKSRTLQSLLWGFRMKGASPTRVDLRFDKPVVTF